LSAAITLLGSLASCGHAHAPRALDEIRARGELRVVTLNLPTCYYFGAQGAEGLEFELARAYAARLRVKLTINALGNETAMQAELAAGRADIAAASLTDYAISDAREFSFAHHLYSNVLVGFALPEERRAQWLVRRGGPDLLASVNAFFRELDVSGTLARLVQQSSGDTRRFAYGESREFQAHVGDRLPRYRSWFEQAAAQAGIDWRLLAAIGYQESKWDQIGRAHV